jgi:hypothetical protein
MMFIVVLLLSLCTAYTLGGRFECGQGEGGYTCNNVGDVYTDRVDIRGIERVALLRALWENQRDLYHTPGSPEHTREWNHASPDIASFIPTQKITIFGGRAIFMDMRGNVVNTAIYDATAKRPAFDIINDIRCQMRPRQPGEVAHSLPYSTFPYEFKAPAQPEPKVAEEEDAPDEL